MKRGYRLAQRGCRLVQRGYRLVQRGHHLAQRVRHLAQRGCRGLQLRGPGAVPRRALRSAGFTLLEVMIAMAILAGALTGLSLALTRAARASMHARMMTTATYLCRQQMAELEDTFVVDGFVDQAGSVEKQVEYKDPAFKDIYSASYVIDKIKLPSADQMQSAATKLLQDKQKIGSSGSSGSSSSSSSSSSSNLSSSMGGFLGPVKEMLEQGIRRVTVRVKWHEAGVGDQQVELVAFYTDMRRLPLVR